MEWPSLLRESNYELWKEEWERHGSCSQAMLPQHAFFETALKLKEKYKLQEMLAEKGLSSLLKAFYSFVQLMLPIYEFNNFLTKPKLT